MKTNTKFRISLSVIIGLFFVLSGSYLYGQDSTETVTDIDGNIYNTIKIGTQTWMVEDLKVTKYNGGVPIMNITDKDAWNSEMKGAYSWYNNDASFKTVYGALYNFAAINTGNLAPKGWHVATEEEWQILVDFLGGEKIAGGKLKESGTSNWTKPNNADNSSGFNALPGGWRLAGDTWDFMNIGDKNLWWTSSNKNFLQAKSVAVAFKSTGISIAAGTKKWGMGVRCIKD